MEAIKFPGALPRTTRRTNYKTGIVYDQRLEKHHHPDEEAGKRMRFESPARTIAIYERLVQKGWYFAYKYF